MGTTIRTTLALDEDVMILAQQTAQRERISLGKAVSELVRRAQQTAEPPAPARPRSPYTVYPARTGPLISSQDVYRLMEEEGI